MELDSVWLLYTENRDPAAALAELLFVAPGMEPLLLPLSPELGGRCRGLPCPCLPPWKLRGGLLGRLGGLLLGRRLRRLDRARGELVLLTGASPAAAADPATSARRLAAVLLPAGEEPTGEELPRTMMPLRRRPPAGEHTPWTAAVLGLGASNLASARPALEEAGLAAAPFIAQSQQMRRLARDQGLECHYEQFYPGVGKAGEIAAYGTARQVTWALDRALGEADPPGRDLFRCCIDLFDHYLARAYTHQAILAAAAAEMRPLPVRLLGTRDHIWAGLGSFGVRTGAAERAAGALVYHPARGLEPLRPAQGLRPPGPAPTTNAAAWWDRALAATRHLGQPATAASHPDRPVLLLANARGRSNYRRGLDRVVQALARRNAPFLLHSTSPEVRAAFLKEGLPLLAPHPGGQLELGDLPAEGLELLTGALLRALARADSLPDTPLLARFCAALCANRYGADQLMAAFTETLRARLLLADLAPRALLMIPYMAQGFRAWEGAAQTLAIPTFTLATAGYPPHARGVPWTSHATTFFVNGSTSGGSLRALGHPPERVAETGNPIYDSMLSLTRADLAPFLADLGLAPGKEIILAATSGLVETELPWLAETARLCRRRGDLQLVLKPHPSIPREDYASLAGQAAILDPAVDLQRLIMACRILITDWSTAGLEACIAGKPFIVANLTGRPYPYRYDQEGIALLAESAAEVARCSEQILDHRATADRLAAAQAAQARRYNGDNDGNAAERVAERLISAGP